MPTREQVRTLVAAGLGYDEVAARLGTTPGLAYLIATGLPADGSDAPSARAHERPGFLETSQHLANPEPASNPTSRHTVQEWIRSRVASDHAMQAAAAARTVTPGAVEEVDGPVDLVDVLTRDHNQLNALLKQLGTIPGVTKGGDPDDLATRAAVVRAVRSAMPGHDAAEDQVLWPTVRATLPEGDDRADEGLRQAQHGHDVLAALEGLDASQEEFDDRAKELVSAAQKHAAYAERLFLELRDKLSRDELVDLGRRAAAAHDPGTGGTED